MNKNKQELEIFLKDGCKISPNGFALDLVDEEKEKFVFSFADMNKDEGRIDVLSEVSIPEAGFKIILKRIFEVAFEYEEKTGIDLIKQVLEEDNEEEVGVFDGNKC